MVGLVLWFYPELVRRDQMARNLLREQEELTAQQTLRKQREREVYLLESDKEYIETIARDKLDMMKEGETIFRLDPSKGFKPAAKVPIIVRGSRQSSPFINPNSNLLAMIEQLETVDTSAISARLAELRRFL